MALSVNGRTLTIDRFLPDLVRPQRGALANALAAVDRDRQAAAQRALGERFGDFDSVVTLLAGDLPVAQPASSLRTASMVSASAGVLSGR